MIIVSAIFILHVRAGNIPRPLCYLGRSKLNRAAAALLHSAHSAGAAIGDLAGDI